VLIWMDLEMTGLDPGTDVIVEIATLATDDELEIVAEGPDLVVHQPEEALASMAPVVTEMHTSSGLIDSGYRGELSVLLVNTDPAEPFTIARGDRIAQLVIQRVEQADFVEVVTLEETSRGAGGWGHTG
jgi:deoxyuridine 5'-triphosphate nucleotidohydrolase